MDVCSKFVFQGYVFVFYVFLIQIPSANTTFVCTFRQSVHFLKPTRKPTPHENVFFVKNGSIKQKLAFNSYSHEEICPHKWCMEYVHSKQKKLDKVKTKIAESEPERLQSFPFILCLKNKFVKLMHRLIFMSNRVYRWVNCSYSHPSREFCFQESW